MPLFARLNRDKFNLLSASQLSIVIPRASWGMTLFMLVFLCLSAPASAATSVPFTINLSEPMNVTGTPRIAVDVGGVTRYATYSSGTSTATLTFTYDMVAGDVDLDGVTISSPIDLNGGTIKDLAGNDLTPLTFTPPNTTNVKVNYPSLGMDFVYDADGRYTLNGTIYNDLTSFLSAAGGSFTRGSVATYFDSAGTLQTAASGVPRFDYDPITHAAKGILIEESRTNLLKRSAEFDNASWVKQTASITANDTTSPSGTTDAEKLIEDTSTGNHHLRQTASAATSGTFTISIYAKQAGRTNILLYMDEGSGTAVSYDFNLNTQAINQIALNAAWTSPTTQIEFVGNGWYRCSLTATRSTSAALVARYAISDGTNYSGGSGLPNYLGDGTSGLYLWGAQIEQATFATSYIPTTSATITRAAEIINIPTNNSWYNASTSTMLAIGDTKKPSTLNSTASLLDIDDGTNTNAAVLRATTLKQAYLMNTGSNVANYLGFGSYSINTPIKAAMAFATNNVNAAFDGTLGTLDTSAAIPNFTFLRLSQDRGGGGNFINGHIQKVKYYPARVTDTQLRLLTQ